MKTDELLFQGRIRDGKLFLSAKARAAKQLALEEDGPVAVRIGKLQRGRTVDQNALLWLYIHKIARETRNEPDAIYAWICQDILFQRFAQVRFNGRTEDVLVHQTTSRLSMKRFTSLLWEIEARTKVPVPASTRHLLKKYAPKKHQ